MKLSCSKCHFELFFTTVTNDKAGHLPVPFDSTPFSFTPTMTARPHKRDWFPFAFSTYPVLTILPRARTGSESIAHEAFGLMGY